VFSPTRVHHGAPGTQPLVCQAGSGPDSHFSCTAYVVCVHTTCRQLPGAAAVPHSTVTIFVKNDSQIAVKKDRGEEG